jgi:DNA-binding transcriptional LysR family regulator
MNLNLLPDLALFVQIVDQGSFSAVARISGATPSAISRSVSRLEQQMGCKLLHRSTRKLRLSDAGKRCMRTHRRCWNRLARRWIPPAVRRKWRRAN